jgi:hypothetical protein
MVLADYLASIEGTEREEKFFAKTADIFKDLEEAFTEAPQLFKIKLMAALHALCKSTSVAEFRETKHYDYLSDWQISEHEVGDGDFTFSLTPSKEIMAKVKKVAIGVAIGIAALVWWRRRKKRRA